MRLKLKSWRKEHWSHRYQESVRKRRMKIGRKFVFLRFIFALTLFSFWWLLFLWSQSSFFLSFTSSHHNTLYVFGLFLYPSHHLFFYSHPLLWTEGDNPLKIDQNDLDDGDPNDDGHHVQTRRQPSSPASVRSSGGAALTLLSSSLYPTSFSASGSLGLLSPSSSFSDISTLQKDDGSPVGDEDMRRRRKLEEKKDGLIQVEKHQVGSTDDHHDDLRSIPLSSKG